VYIRDQDIDTRLAAICSKTF